LFSAQGAFLLAIYTFFSLITKSPSAKAKGLGFASSPYWTLSELLREILQLKILD